MEGWLSKYEKGGTLPEVTVYGKKRQIPAK